jgi:hypothetical protein
MVRRQHGLAHACTHAPPAATPHFGQHPDGAHGVWHLSGVWRAAVRLGVRATAPAPASTFAQGGGALTRAASDARACTRAPRAATPARPLRPVGFTRPRPPPLSPAPGAEGGRLSPGADGGTADQPAAAVDATEVRARPRYTSSCPPTAVRDAAACASTGPTLTTRARVARGGAPPVLMPCCVFASSHVCIRYAACSVSAVWRCRRRLCSIISTPRLQSV